MDKDAEKKSKYWRVSLADIPLWDGQFTQRDRKRFTEVSGETVRSGKLPDEGLDGVFGGQKSTKSVAVRFCSSSWLENLLTERRASMAYSRSLRQL